MADELKESNDYINENKNGFIHRDYINVNFDIAITTSKEHKTGVVSKLSVANLRSFGSKEENTNPNTK